MSLSFDNPECPTTPTPLPTDTLVDSVLILLGLSVVQRLVGFVRAVLFCRWLDAEQLGLWDMAFSFLLLAAPWRCWRSPARSAATWSITANGDNSTRSCGGQFWPAAG